MYPRDHAVTNNAIYWGGRPPALEKSKIFNPVFLRLVHSKAKPNSTSITQTYKKISNWQQSFPRMKKKKKKIPSKRPALPNP
jgi:hypothetical protein